MKVTIGAARGCGCLVSGLAFLIGGLLLVVAVAWGVRSYDVEQNWVAVPGVVVDLVPNTDGDTYAPVVEYQPSDGDTRRFEHNVFSNTARIGDSVDVRYDPENPSEAVAHSWAGFWLGPMILGAAGIAFVAVTIAVGLLVRRRRDGNPKGTPMVFNTGPRRPAEFRRVETDIDGNGIFRWQIVAKDEDGTEYRSDWLDEDPQMDLMAQGYRVALIQRGGAWIVIPE